MTFPEAIEKYGLEEAARMFGLSDHAVIILHPSKEGDYVSHVSLTCGNYRASEPTIHGSPSKTTEEAIEALKRPLKDTGITYETLTA